MENPSDLDASLFLDGNDAYYLVQTQPPGHLGEPEVNPKESLLYGLNSDDFLHIFNDNSSQFGPVEDYCAFSKKYVYEDGLRTFLYSNHFG